MELRETLSQKQLAINCKKWLKSSKVNVRSIRQGNFLHGKMYNIINSAATGRQSHSVIGSSNFTQSGLGLNKNPNMELNLAVEGDAVCQQMHDWFDNIWNDEELTEDVEDKVIAALDRIGKEQSPEFIYYKSLYEIFKERLDEEKKFDEEGKSINFTETAIYKKLYEFQKHGVNAVLHRLKKHRGCILADSVGLGKTYTALGVIRYYELQNKNVLVLSPKKLQGNWNLYRAAANHKGNPFASDRFAYNLLFHSDLSRTNPDGKHYGISGDIDLANFNWNNFDLVVIDESHNFRNDALVSKSKKQNSDEHKRSRYGVLLEKIIKTGKKTQMLMLSATPVNNSLRDLRNQIYLMTEKNKNHFAETMGIKDIESFFTKAEKQFNQWSNEKEFGKKDELCASLGGEFFNLLNEVTIARSRKLITKYYKDEMENIGGFPERAKPENEYPATDTKGGIKYKNIYETIEDFGLSIYNHSEYLVPGSSTYKKQQKEEEKTNFSQRNREHYLIGMMRTNFFKRLESSVHSFAATLERTIDKSDNLIEKIDKFKSYQSKKENIKPVNDLAKKDGLDEDEYQEDQDFMVGMGEKDGIKEDEYQEDQDFMVGKKQSLIPLADINTLSRY